jgi:hypothetical protein
LGSREKCHSNFVSSRICEIGGWRGGMRQNVMECGDERRFRLRSRRSGSVGGV